MRNHLIAELEKIAVEDSRVVVLTADLGYSVLDSFARRFPDRCLNVGICEQNMTAVAAGLALEGHVVYTYSIGNFPVMRCLEQIRNCVCYHDANVKIIAVGGGFVYGQLGMSHHATEDLAVTRALPNMRGFCPADPDEAVKVVRAVHGMAGPCYIRLARGGEPRLHSDVSDYDVMRLLTLQEGRDVAVMATGPVLSEALAAARQLNEEGVRIGVYNCISLKPFDVESLRAIAERYHAIVSLEEHNVIGGLGSALADALLSLKSSRLPRLVKLGLQDVYTSVVGSQSYLRQEYGLASADVVRTVKELLP
jgi:transketolase